ncbi:MAG: hypothetical protein C4551_06675 [Bacillota bacterium]|nr:MAG: hypothetical protein C4551_06675 [Bacillota bacterium]
MRIALLRLRDFKDMTVPQSNFDALENFVNKELPTEVPECAAGSYTGTDAANRVKAVGFMPRYVIVYDPTGGNTFEAIGSGDVALEAWYRGSTGAHVRDTTQWQGIATTGFKCGSAAASASNVSGRTYYYFAVR